MNTIEVCVCEAADCGRPILTPELGFIVEGGIYAADPKKHLGIIGNGEGRKTAYCRDCFIKLLGLGPKNRDRESDPFLGIMR
jgi:hypothetical protein